MSICEQFVPSLSTLILAFSVGVFSYVKAKSEATKNRLRFKWEYFSRFEKWAKVSVDCLSNVVHFCEFDPARCEDGYFFRQRQAYRSELSALIDQGRWVFPNRHQEVFGANKSAAYQGFRAPMIDALVAAYDALSRLDYMKTDNHSEIRNLVVDSKRSFTTSMQVIFDPAGQDKDFKKCAESINWLAIGKDIDEALKHIK